MVDWIIADSPILGISDDQILEFQSLKGEDGDNVRKSILFNPILIF